MNDEPTSPPSTAAQTLAGQAWLKKKWNLRNNPFPHTAIARIGGNDLRENGLLYEPAVQADQVREAMEKFVLGSAFSGLKFGYLWSRGSSPADSDARGYGKSVLLQHVARLVNRDFGRSVYLLSELDDEDAAENPICSLVTSFDTAQVRSLGAALFAAVEYGVKFRTLEEPPLAQRLRQELIDRIGTDDQRVLLKAVADEQNALHGRTLGPPDERLLVALCGEDPTAVVEYLNSIKAATRSRNGAVFFATFLLYAAAAGMKHVLVCCDQLEDLASSNTAKSKRDLETERFRDVLVETQPMADMVSIIVTMHPRAAMKIKNAWDQADLPSFEDTDANNRSTVTLPGLQDVEEARKLLSKYMDAAVQPDSGREPGSLHPLTEDAVAVLLSHSTRKPRDVLRMAHSVLEEAAARNLEVVGVEQVRRLLDTITPVPHQEGLDSLITAGVLDWSQG
ncbi:hypothetical protein ACFVUQ_27115 [Streptomyces cyaneofuscatus]|uniref:hypothetical protein n=1 Tax=Streptomyces cyaneofuscatus TaxID=66883 RepID=UPI0036D850A0